MKVKIWNILAVIGFLSVLMFFLFLYLLFNISNPEQEITLKKYDAIVVLSGNPIRAELGGKLFQDGLSKMILLSKEKKIIYNYLEPEKEVMTYELYLSILIRNKVPKSAIKFFGEDNKSTYDEAKSLSTEDYKNLKNLLVVTNKYHIFRSKLIFKKLLPQRDIDFISPEHYIKYKKNRDHKASSQQALIEIFKTIYNIIFRVPFFSNT